MPFSHELRFIGHFNTKFLHQVVGFHKDSDNFAVVFDIIVCECAVFAVFEPLLRGLIAADIEVPRQLGNILETL